jgi:hypothetical protein
VKPDEAEPNEHDTSILYDDKLTVKSRTSNITFRENYSNYNTSGSYVPRKEKAHRRLLATQKSMSELSFKDSEISPKYSQKEPSPKFLMKSQVEFRKIETAP